MRNKLLLAALLILLAPLYASATTVTLIGVVMNPVGSVPLQGQVCLQLPVNGIDTSTNRTLTTLANCFRMVNGTFPAFATVVPNDVISPTNTYYITTYYDRTGLLVGMANYVIPTGGGTFNVGLAVPSSVTTSNISFISPAALGSNQTFTGLNTFTQQISSTVTSGTAPFSIASSTVVPNLNVQILNGVSITGGAPVNGALLQATSGSTASWTTLATILSFYTDAGSLATSTNSVVKLTGVPSNVTNVLTTDTGGAIGICSFQCGALGQVGITTTGQANCAFDGATTAGDYVQISSTVAGDCHDVGASYPNSGQVLGRVLGTNGAGGIYNMTLFGIEIRGSTPSVTGQVFGSATTYDNTAIAGSTVTAILHKAITMPSSGCPCRALVSYSSAYTVASQGITETWISDAVNTFGFNEAGINAANLTNMGVSASDISPVTYANGANVTFTVNVEANQAITMVTPNFTGTPYLRILILTSN